jgi:general secretion pathway protein G
MAPGADIQSTAEVMANPATNETSDSVPKHHTSDITPCNSPSRPRNQVFCPRCLQSIFMKRRARPNHGLTLVELMVVMAIIGTLAAIALPMYSDYVDKAKTARAISEIHTVQLEIMAVEQPGYLPEDLNAIGRGGLLDPWGNPYQYQSFALVPKGKWRKDRFLVPLNSTFDLWSMGPDGKSKPPLTAKDSKDDIIRANDGGFIGRADRY